MTLMAIASFSETDNRVRMGEEEEDDGSVGARIRLARERMGLGQSELADRIGVRPPTMWRYENDRVTPGAEAAARLERELGVSVQWLMLDEGSRESPGGGGSPKAVEDFLEGPEGARVTEVQARALRSIRFGDVEPTVGMVRSIWLEMAASPANDTDTEPKKRKKTGKR